MKKLALHWKILIGMILGVIFGIIMLQVSSGEKFVADCRTSYFSITDKRNFRLKKYFQV